MSGKKKVLVVYKKTTLQCYGKDDERIAKLLAAGDASVDVLEHAHATHVATLEATKAHLKGRRDVAVTFRHQHEDDGNGWDLVITLGREATLNPLPGTRVQNWDTDEPSERGIDGLERMRLVRDDITARVQQLHTTLTNPTT